MFIAIVLRHPVRIDAIHRLADAWIAAPTATRERVGELLAVFHAERTAAGLAPVPDCPIIRECFVGANAGQARAVSRGPLLYKYEAYASWGQTDTGSASLAERFDEFSAERFLVGDAAAVRDELTRYREELGTDHLLLRVQWPGLALPDALGNIERIGRVVAGL